MKKRFVAIVMFICIISALIPMMSLAAVTPYFVAVNDTLLPFNAGTMPYIAGGEIFVPPVVFGGVGVHYIDSVEFERVRVYRGSEMYVDLYITSGIAEDHNGTILRWPSARRVGGRFYVPLRQVCAFFGLAYEIIDVRLDVIPQEQMRLIRITPSTGFSGLNTETFMGMNGNALRKAYDNHYSPTPALPSLPPTSPGMPTTSPPVVEPPAKYDDVTIHHSFFGISAGGAEMILELLDTGAMSEYRFCFFVSADDIIEDAGLIRRISGNGHAIGIWLSEGTYDEYIVTSALLFEAAKIRTVLVSADDEEEGAPEAADDDRLIFWSAAKSLVYDDTLSLDEVITMISQESGTRQTFVSSCSEFTALMLSGILSYLRDYEYSVVGITETVEPPGAILRNLFLDSSFPVD